MTAGHTAKRCSESREAGEHRLQMLRPKKVVSSAASALVVLMAMVLTGCGTSGSGGPFADKDGPPRRHVDIASIPDATPRLEPKSKYGNPASYSVGGRRYYVLGSSVGYRKRGVASWYGTKFHGRRTASGERYDMFAMTAAHKTLPLPTYVRVTNLRNGRRVIVKVNDRGPFHNNRLIDLSYAAAYKLGIVGHGTGLVEVDAIDPRARRPVLVDAASVDEQINLYLQVGAFASQYNAERLRDRLLAAAIDGIRISQARPNQTTVYRVRVGPIGSVEDADRLAARIISLGMETPQVIID